MHQTNQQATSFSCWLLLPLLTAGEYYFLQAAPAHTKLYLFGLKFCERRLLVPAAAAGSLAACFCLHGRRAESKSETEQGQKAGSRDVALAALLYRKRPAAAYRAPQPLVQVCLPGRNTRTISKWPSDRQAAAGAGRKPNAIQNDTRKDENRYSLSFSVPGRHMGERDQSFPGHLGDRGSRLREKLLRSRTHTCPGRRKRVYRNTV